MVATEKYEYREGMRGNPLKYHYIIPCRKSVQGALVTQPDLSTKYFTDSLNLPFVASTSISVRAVPKS